MKQLLTILLIIAAFNSQAQLKSANLQASGLTCAMCSKAIYKALTLIPFVEKVQPDIQKSLYQITFKKDQEIDLDALSKAVINAGFSVANMSVTAVFNGVKVQNNTHIRVNDQLFNFMNISAQTLQGTKTMTLVDKNFIPAKDYKKYAKLNPLKCYETGRTAACCIDESLAKKPVAGERIYHVTI